MFNNDDLCNATRMPSGRTRLAGTRVLVNLGRHEVEWMVDVSVRLACLRTTAQDFIASSGTVISIRSFILSVFTGKWRLFV